MWSRVWACITQNRTCSRRRFNISNERLRSSLRKSSGNLWLLAATDAWISLTKPWKSTKRSTKKTKTILTVFVDLCPYVVSSAWSSITSKNALPCLIVKKKPSANMNMHRINSTMQGWAVNRASLELRQSLKSARCRIWTIYLARMLTSVAWEAQQHAKKKRKSGTRLLFLTEFSILTVCHNPPFTRQNVSSLSWTFW